MPRALSVASPLLSATRIVATLGPASTREGMVRRLMQAGVDVFRINMSHGDHETHAAVVRRIRKAAKRLARPVGVLIDLQGPKVRSGLNEGEGRIQLRRREIVEMAFGRGRSRRGHIVVDFAGLARDVDAGDRILLDDGKLELRVRETDGRRLLATVIRGGWLKERAGVNVPGRALSVELPTAKDRRDVVFALEQGADFIAMSFVQSAADLVRLRRLIHRHRGRYRAVHAESPAGYELPAIIAKIEKPSALTDLDAILEESDGVMVARGDLGVELSLEKVPTWQKEILRRARSLGRCTITATQMLESMIEAPSPTRAEVSDVANAIYDGTDAVMLSAETAVGSYPVESVQTLTRTACEAESEIRRSEHFVHQRQTGGPITGTREAVVRAAVALAEQAGARAIVSFTLSGRTAGLIARHRPNARMIAVTPYEDVRRRLTLRWNTQTLILPFVNDPYRMMSRGLDVLSKARLVRKGDILVIVSGDQKLTEATNLLRVVRVGGDGSY